MSQHIDISSVAPYSLTCNRMAHCICNAQMRLVWFSLSRFVNGQRYVTCHRLAPWMHKEIIFGFYRRRSVHNVNKRLGPTDHKGDNNEPHSPCNRTPNQVKGKSTKQNQTTWSKGTVGPGRRGAWCPPHHHLSRIRCHKFLSIPTTSNRSRDTHTYRRGPQSRMTRVYALVASCPRHLRHLPPFCVAATPRRSCAEDLSRLYCTSLGIVASIGK